ncbi:MAG: 30S ribosome-binding factor RbfA [Acidobacteria bacterium]|nr:MAG: 30S ribosome-binding factor RbfA [Acidobacteriota bacterium]
MSTRTDRVSDLIKGEISRLLLREVRDPRVGFVTITGATVSPDLKNVRVFVSILGEPQARQDSLNALNSAVGYFKRMLFRNLRLRFAPTVLFRLDESLDRGDRIERVLREIHDGQRAAGDPGEEE